MNIEILGWAFLALVALAFAVGGARAFVVKKMAESFDIGMKLGILRGQLGQDAIDQMLRDAGVEPNNLPGRAS